MSGYWVEVETMDQDHDGSSNSEGVGPFQSKATAQACADRINRRLGPDVDRANDVTSGQIICRATARPLRRDVYVIAETLAWLDNYQEDPVDE